MKFELDRDQYETVIEALISAFNSADRYYREEREKKPEIAGVLEKERDEFQEVLEHLDKQAPEEWKEEDGSQV